MGKQSSAHEQLLHDTSIKGQGNHDVALENFLNAQCMIDLTASFLFYNTAIILTHVSTRLL